MRYQVVFDIRDARNLTGNEKALLWAVESRGDVSFGKWQTVAQDAGLGKDAFYAARNYLIAVNLLIEEERQGTTTKYSVNADALDRWKANPSVRPKRKSPTHFKSGVSGNPEGRYVHQPRSSSGFPDGGFQEIPDGGFQEIPDTKENSKVNSKEYLQDLSTREMIERSSFAMNIGKPRSGASKLRSFSFAGVETHSALLRIKGEQTYQEIQNEESATTTDTVSDVDKWLKQAIKAEHIELADRDQVRADALELIQRDDYRPGERPYARVRAAVRASDPSWVVV